MEGIAGTYGFSDVLLVRKMLSRLEHRGPERVQVVSEPKAVLGGRTVGSSHGRKVVAVAQSSGISAASDSYMFNRNFLRRTIAPKVSPESSDAELVVEMYKAIGTRMFGYIDGAYAIAVVDHGRTILARDEYGMKPLYISTSPHTGAYSSEMKSQILSGDAFAPFPPGRVFTSGAGFRKTYLRSVDWGGEDLPKDNGLRMRKLLVSGVGSCADGVDGPWNVLLSGGLNSSVIAAAARSLSPDVRTVCVGTEDSEDIKMARAVAKRLRTDHDERVFDQEDVLKVLDKVIYYAETFNYPMIRNCIPDFIAAHALRGGGRVILSGEGGDELFAGYEYLRRIKKDRQLWKRRIDLLSSAYLSGFQRVDRMASSASLEGRLPLMTSDIISFGLGLSRKDLFGTGPGQTKLIMREAFEDFLPRKVIWRTKKRFAEGAGSSKMLVPYAEQQISDAEFDRVSRRLPKGRLRTKEELLYFKIFEKHFPSKSAISSVGVTNKPQ